jgi:hypothetical protein
MQSPVLHDHADLGEIRLHSVTAGHRSAMVLLHRCRRLGSFDVM